MMFLTICAVSGVLSLLLTGLMRRYALARSLVDIPNERSSHTTPIPRGGGMAIVLTFLLAMLFIAHFNLHPMQSLLVLFGAGSIVALVGFFDDHGHIPARWRLFAHFIGAGWALGWLGGLPPLPIFGYMVDLGWPGHLLAAVYLVWLLQNKLVLTRGCKKKKKKEIFIILILCSFFFK